MSGVDQLPDRVRTARDYQDRIIYRKTYTNFRFSETSSWWTT
ncbi:hypothetical protein [Streptomyces sp. NPDC007991]